MNDTRDARRQALMHFLRTIQKAGLPVESLADTDRLVGSGLIDSLAIPQIVSYLESTHGMDFSLRGLNPEELGSIGGILDLIEHDKK